MSRNLWLGLDAGSTAIKAAAYTMDGQQVAQAEASSEVRQLPNGGREQDMWQVWETAATVLAQVASHCRDDKIASLGVCGQGFGLWAVDAEGNPVAPAILGSDTRAANDLKALQAAHATQAITSGCQTWVWPGMSGLLWRWQRLDNPKAAKKVAHVYSCSDWIGHRLTGQPATDYSNASIPFMDHASKSYEYKQFAALECKELADLLATFRPAQLRLGGVTAEAAARTGLPEGLTVSVGTLDIASKIVGLGLEKIGEYAIILGTPTKIILLAPRKIKRSPLAGTSVLHPTSNEAVMRMLAANSGTAAIDWYARLWGAAAEGSSAGDVAARIDDLAASAPPGANGVTFLPYLSGERAQFVAPDLQASFHGISESTTGPDMARAVMEGAALTLRHCCVKLGGLPPRQVRITGGGDCSAVWCQIVADVLNQTILVSSLSDHGIWGAACLGAAASGHGSAIRLAQREENLVEQQSNPKSAELYHNVYCRYRDLLEQQVKLLEREEE